MTSSELSGERSGGERMSNVFGLGLLECPTNTQCFMTERGLYRLISGQGLYY